MRLIALLLALFVLTTACGDKAIATPSPPLRAASTPELPIATATTPPSKTVTPSTTASTTSRPGADTVPQGTQTGDPQIDAIISALLAGDAGALRPFYKMTQTRCTTRIGMGGPPKCWNTPGQPPDGTPVEAFPVASCETTWIFDVKSEADSLLSSKPALYAVLEINPARPLFPNEPDYQPIDHYILLEKRSNGQRLGVVLGIADGGIVQRENVCIGPPEGFLEVVEPYRIILRGPAYQ